MKVINRKVANDNYPKRIECDECNSLIEYDREDLCHGAYGLPHLTCPVCDCEIEILDQNEELNLTSKNIEFPQHFYHFGQIEGAVKLEDKEVQKMVRDVLNRFDPEADGDYYCTATGNTLVMACYCEEDGAIMVYVARNYYETAINI